MLITFLFCFVLLLGNLHFGGGEFGQIDSGIHRQRSDNNYSCNAGRIPPRRRLCKTSGTLADQAVSDCFSGTDHVTDSNSHRHGYLSFVVVVAFVSA